MKLISLLLFIILFFLVSCSSDSSEESIVEPGSNSTGNLSMQIDEIEWEADIVKAYKQVDFTTIEGIITNLNPTSNYSSISLKIVIKYLNEPRIYGIGESGGGFIYNANASLIFKLKESGIEEIYIGQYVENLSLIDVSELNDKYISGKFGFRASNNKPEPDSLDITNGSFNITF